MLAGNLARLLDRLLCLDCEFVPTNCHLVLLLLLIISLLISLCALDEKAGDETTISRSFLSFTSGAELRCNYPFSVRSPLPILICLGLASARFASVIFRMPFS